MINIKDIHVQDQFKNPPKLHKKWQINKIQEFYNETKASW